MPELKKRTPRTTACISAHWSLTDSDFLTDLVQLGPGKIYPHLLKYWAEEGRDQSMVFVDDFSRTGLRVTGDQCLLPDSLVLLQVNMGASFPVHCIARVVWSRGWRQGVPVHFAGLKILWIDRQSAEILEEFTKSSLSPRWPGSELSQSEKAKWIRLKKEKREQIVWDKQPTLNRGSRPLQHGHWVDEDDGLVKLYGMMGSDFNGLLQREFQLYLSFDFVTRLFSVFGVPGSQILGKENFPGSPA